MNSKTLWNTVKGTAGGLALAFAMAVGPVSGAMAAGNTPPSDEFIHETLASDSKEEVGLRLVLLFDISGSIDMAEYKVQLEAMAKAIESEDFRNAVFYKGGPQSIAICVVDFGDDVSLRIPWLDIREDKAEKFKSLADEVRNLDRRAFGMTHQVKALNAAMLYLENSPWEGKRNIVDIITDGKDNQGWGYGPGSGTTREERLRYVREKLATEYNATVNALITLDNENDFENWAKENLATQPNHFRADGTFLDPGFVKVVATQKSVKSPGATVAYHKAMELAFRRKLILEVSGLELWELRRIMLLQRFPDTETESRKPELWDNGRPIESGHQDPNLN